MQDKAKLEAIAATKSMGSPGQQLAWMTALEAFVGLPMDDLEAVLGALPTPDLALSMGKFLAREEHPLEALRNFMREVDESRESLEEWLKAFEVFACFIESTAHRPTLGQATGYLHCCVSAAHTGSSYATFPMAVETMLETYGYSGQKD